MALASGTYTISVIHTAYSTKLKQGLWCNRALITVLKLNWAHCLWLDDFVVTVPEYQDQLPKYSKIDVRLARFKMGLGQDLARSPDGSASSASRRIVGASVIGGQFLVVRGLGGRYTSVRLNNVPLPSTDPDMPVCRWICFHLVSCLV